MGSGGSSRSVGKPTNTHLPFRDSKLTRLLSAALGGNSRTVVICNISPADRNREESISTLTFAVTCSKVVNHAKRNMVEAQNAMLTVYLQEIDELKVKLANQHATHHETLSRAKLRMKFKHAINSVRLETRQKLAVQRGAAAMSGGRQQTTAGGRRV